MPDTDNAKDILQRPVHESKCTDRTEDVPAAAMQFNGTEFSLGDNGDGAKSAPVRILASSKGKGRHWYWGTFVRDLAGMKTHKDRFPIDYVHNCFDVMGYVNKFEIADDGLVLSGALVPFKDSDRATEVIHKSKNGVPYEASLDTGIEDMVVEEVPDGMSVEVNGLTFAGPLVVFRQWRLRGVAICPQGADMNTATEFKLSQSDTKTVPVTFQKAAGQFSEENQDMTDETTDKNEQTKPEESEKKDVDKGAKTEESEKKDVDTEKKTTDAADGGEAAESENKDADATDKASAESKPADGAGEMSAERTECKQFIDAFGEQGGKWFAEGKTFEEASKRHFDGLKTENDALKKRLAAAGEGEPDPVEFQSEKPADDKKPNALADKIGDGLATFAAGMKLPQNK